MYVNTHTCIQMLLCICMHAYMALEQACAYRCIDTQTIPAPALKPRHFAFPATVYGRHHRVLTPPSPTFSLAVSIFPAVSSAQDLRDGGAGYTGLRVHRYFSSGVLRFPADFGCAGLVACGRPY